MDKKGKKFEEKFKESWESTFGDKKLLLRLPDQQSYYKGSSKNPCDFIGHLAEKLFMLEIKTTKDTTLHIKSKFKQYEELLEYKDYDDVYPGVVVWFYNYDIIYYAPIEEVEKMVRDGKKSLHKDFLKSGEYKVIEIPHVIPRTWPKCDLSIFKDITK